MKSQPWRERAACRGEDPNLFFPDSEDEAAPALAVCAGCPVREECLDWAIAARQWDGVWGGTTETERRRVARSRRTAAASAA